MYKEWKATKSLSAAAAAKSLQLCPTLCDPIRKHKARACSPDWGSEGCREGFLKNLPQAYSSE